MKNYEIKVIPKKDINGRIYWTALFPCIEGCVGGGETPEEAIVEAQENLEIYLEYLKEEKCPLPNEYIENNCNGKIALRVGKTTHHKLLQLAEDEGISLNSIINNAIEYYLGKKSYDIEFNEKIEQIKELSESSNNLQKVNFLSNQAIVGELWKRNIKYRMRCSKC